MRPSYKKPYYYIHNVNTSVGKSSNNVSNLNPTNIIVDNSDSNTSIKIKGTDGSLPTSLTLSGGDSDDLIEKPQHIDMEMLVMLDLNYVMVRIIQYLS